VKLYFKKYIIFLFSTKQVYEGKRICCPNSLG